MTTEHGVRPSNSILLVAALGLGLTFASGVWFSAASFGRLQQTVAAQTDGLGGIRQDYTDKLNTMSLRVTALETARTNEDEKLSSFGATIIAMQDTLNDTRAGVADIRRMLMQRTAQTGCQRYPDGSSQGCGSGP